MDLKEKLVELRREKGWTQDELALKVGVTRQAVSKWERGVIAPSTVNLITLGRLYGIPLDELANGGPSEEAEGVETPGTEVETPKGEAAITPETPPPREKASPLKLAGAAMAAVLILLVSIASVITIGSALLKEPEKPKDGLTIINQDDMLQEDIDLTKVIDSTKNSGIIFTDEEH